MDGCMDGWKDGIAIVGSSYQDSYHYVSFLCIVKQLLVLLIFENFPFIILHSIIEVFHKKFTKLYIQYSCIKLTTVAACFKKKHTEQLSN